MGPRWAVALALPVGKGADRIAKYKHVDLHVKYIYTTQLAEPAFAIPSSSIAIDSVVGRTLRNEKTRQKPELALKQYSHADS